MKKSLALAVFFTAFFPAFLSAETLRPNMTNVLFDSNGKVVGAPIYVKWVSGNFGNYDLDVAVYLRFTKASGGDIYVALKSAGQMDAAFGWEFFMPVYTTDDCSGSAFYSPDIQGTTLLPMPPASAGRLAMVASKFSGGNGSTFLYEIDRAAVSLAVRSRQVGAFPPCQLVDVQANAYPTTELLNMGEVYSTYLDFAPPALPEGATFSDVPTDHWAFPAIERLKDSRITAGCTATEFCPGYYVTRAEMAWFLTRALGLVPLP